MTHAPPPHRVGILMALLQLVFTLGWTVYAIYLPQLAQAAGLPGALVIWLLMLDQAIFAASDLAMGVWADRMIAVVGRLGRAVALLTLLSGVAFLALPFLALGGAGKYAFIAVTVVWIVTASALRAPPLTLLGKYAAKPALPWLAALATLGYGIASALAPYLALILRDVDARIPFVLASIAVVSATFGLTWAERALAAGAATKAAAPSPTTESPAHRQSLPALRLFAFAVLVFGLGFQLHVSLNSAGLFRRVAEAGDVARLMPVFWIGFNLMLLPASVVTRRIGAMQMMVIAGVVGAAAMALAAAATTLGFLLAAQFAAGAAWGALLMSASAGAVVIGATGAEGRVLGLMFAALALATFSRIAAVAADLPHHAVVAMALPWLPAALWLAAGILLGAAFWPRRDAVQTAAD